MNPEEIEQALSQLTDPTTAPALAEALGYKSSASINRACLDQRIPGIQKSGSIWLIPLDGVREAIKNGKLRPGWKQ